MDIKNEKTYNEIDNRIEEFLEKGTKLGGMDYRILPCKSVLPFPLLTSE